MFAKISRALAKKSTWERVFSHQEKSEQTVAWDSLHFAVNPPTLIENSSWRPPLRFFEYAPHGENQKWQWIGQKSARKNTLTLNERTLSLDSREALSEMLNWNALSGSLILEGLREISSVYKKGPLELARLNLSDETKSLEWMRVSFDLLKKAITNCPSEFSPQRDSTFFSQSLLFWHEPDQEEQIPHMRLISFNLDINLHPYLTKINDQEVWALEIAIYNHKGGEAKEASLNSNFIYYPRAAIDLVASILETSKQHFYWPLAEQ